MISIIIPSRNEIYLTKTVEDILQKAKGEIEIIMILDGYWQAPIDDPRVKVIHFGKSRGMRNGINAGVAMAKGEYILKCDGHVMFDEGFDLKLLEHIEKDWIVIPRRKRLDAVNWQIQDVGKPDVDYEFLSFPDNPADFGGEGLNGRIWTEKILKLRDDPKFNIDDNLSFQGSCWFMHKEYFYFLELMDEEHYGTFWNEAQEIGFKCWLSGGRVVINKNTWYAHLHKGKEMGRGYSLDKRQLNIGSSYTKRWMTEFPMWHKQKYPFSHMIKKFMPMPGWDDEKLENLIKNYEKNGNKS